MSERRQPTSRMAKVQATRTNADLTTGNACWETAPKVFEKLNHDFGPFDIDLTADGSRHCCPMWFGPGSPFPDTPHGNPADALAVNWAAFGKNGYSNPAYATWFVARMLAKARIQAYYSEFSTTLLLAMRVTDAFKRFVLKGASQLLFCDSRVVFFEHGAPRLNAKMFNEHGKLVPDSAMFDSIIVRYTPGHPETAPPSIGTWQVPPHVTAEDLDRAADRYLART